MQKKTKILIIEDLSSDVVLMERELRKALKNLQTKVVDNEKDFLKALEKFQPDLIISDYSMPTFDGMSALKLTLKKTPLTPFILCTGSMNEETAVECMKIGATDYVIKEHISRLGQAALHALKEKEVRLEKIRTESALRESEEKYRLIVENANDGIEITQDDRIIFCNTRFAEMLGYTVEELKNVPFSQIFSEKATRELRERHKQREAGKPVPSQYESTFRKKDGTIIDVAVNYEITDYQGRPATLAIIRDITEHKQSDNLRTLQYKLAQAAVRAENAAEFHEMIWDSLSDLMNLENFYVAFFDDENKRFSAVFERDEKDQIPEWPADKSMTGQVIQQKKSLLLKKADIHKLADRGNVELIGSVPEVWLGVPLWVGGKPAGALVIQDYDDPNACRQYHQEILEMVAREFGTFLDVRNARNALEESEKKYRTLVNSTLQGVVIAHVNPVSLVFANPAMGQISGYAPEKLIEMGPIELANLIHEEDRQQFFSRFQKRIQGEDISQKSEYRIVTKDGKIKWVVIYASLIEYQNEPAVLGTFMDITERKQAEEALKESKVSLQAVLDATTDGILAIGRDNKVLYTNDRFAEMWRIPADVMESRDDAVLLQHVLDQLAEPEAFFKKVRKLYDSDKASFDEIHFKDGRVFERLSRPLLMDSELSGRVWSFRDITERKQAEERIKSNEARLQSLVRIMQYQSESVQEILDYALEEAIQLTESKIGYIYFYNEEKKEFTLNTWSHSVLEECSVANPQTVYQLEKTGIWGEAVRQRKKIVVNDFQAPHPLKKGYPEGHAPLYKYLTVPVFSGDKIVAVVGVANKETDYDHNDVLQLQLLMDGVWKEVERKRSEELLAKSESFLSDVFSSIQDGISVLDKDLKIIHTNHVMKKWYAENMPLQGKKCFVCYHNAKQPCDPCPSLRCLESGKTEKDIIPGLPGSSVEWIELFSFPMKDKDSNEITGVVEFVRDITKQKKAEEALQKSEEKFRKLFQKHSAVKLILDPDDGRIVEANEAAARFYGWSIEQLQQMKISQINTLTPEQVNKEMARARKGENIHFEFKHRKADGSICDVEVFSSKITIDDHEYLHSIIHDISERKKAEQQIQLLRRSIEQNPVTIVVTDANGDIEYVNPAFTKVTGYSLAEVIGKNLRILQSGDHPKVFYEELWNTILSGKDWEGEFHNKKKSGELYWEDATISPIFNDRDEITHFVAVKEDITKQKQMEAEKEVLEAQLQQSQKLESVGTLASGVAHDFNNLLTVIMGHAQMGMMQTSENELLNHSLKEIVTASTRAADLTRQLLIFSRKQSMEFKPVDLNKTVQNLLKMLGRLIGENIEIETALEPAVWKVEADEGNIEQVLTNLAVNARDAMPDGGKLIIKTENVKISEDDTRRILNSEAGNYVRISVSDDGTGIPPEIRDKIFDPFFTTKEVGKGTGLGLSVVYGIVKKHRGWINVYSEEGHGTRFSIYLPAAESSPEDGADKNSVDFLSLNGDGERILLIEDEKGVLDFTESALTKYNYQVFTAISGQEAQAIYATEAGNFDLIFSDVILPDANGLELVKSMTVGKPKLPVILASGYTDEHIREQISKEKSFRFLQKPYSVKKILETVKSALKSSR